MSTTPNKNFEHFPITDKETDSGHIKAKHAKVLAGAALALYGTALGGSIAKGHYETQAVRQEIGDDYSTAYARLAQEIYTGGVGGVMDAQSESIAGKGTEFLDILAEENGQEKIHTVNTNYLLVPGGFEYKGPINSIESTGEVGFEDTSIEEELENAPHPAAPTGEASMNENGRMNREYDGTYEGIKVVYDTEGTPQLVGTDEYGRGNEMLDLDRLIAEGGSFTFKDDKGEDVVIDFAQFSKNESTRGGVRESQLLDGSEVVREQKEEVDASMQKLMNHLYNHAIHIDGLVQVEDDRQEGEIPTLKETYLAHEQQGIGTFYIDLNS